MLKIEKKRLIAALLCASMAASLAACSKTEDKVEETEEETTAEETTEETTAEETTEETTASETAEETTEETVAVSAGEEYQAFLAGLDQAIADGQMYYEGVDGVNGTMNLSLMGSNYRYLFTDLDADGNSELLIGTEYTDSQGTTLVAVDGFVVIDDEGDYNILVTSWERSHALYIGNGCFAVGGSGGYNLSLDTIYRYNGETASFDVVAELVTDSDEADPNELPTMYYTVYEGVEWEYSLDNRACDDPDALHGDEALARWNEIQAEAVPNGNELIGSEWIVNASDESFGLIISEFDFDTVDGDFGERA